MTDFDDPLNAAAPAHAHPEAPATPGSALRWVPIRALSERHRPRVLEHLLALPLRDRYLRFGYAASDTQIGHYVDQLDFDRDEVFGIFNRHLHVVALAHLAYMGAPDRPRPMAEFGVSVAAHARGRGWGARLFDRAVLQARNRHVDTLLIHALSENSAMLHIVRRAGAKVDYEGSDVVAKLPLQPEDFASHLEALVEHQAAEFDYGLKLQVQRVDAWLSMIARPLRAAQEITPRSRDADVDVPTVVRSPETPPPV